MSYTSEQWTSYYSQLRKPFVKLARLRFLNPDDSTAFVLDNQRKNKRSRAFIADGSLSVNLQNGTRRTASIRLENADGEFSYNVEKVWFGSRIALDEGLLLPDGTEFYLPQGVFYVTSPKETLAPANRVSEFTLTDKWAGIDGTINGVLESSYIVNFGANIFNPMRSILLMDKGNGEPYDPVAPMFTDYYNGKTQLLPDGSTAAITDTPYTMTIDSENGTVADVELELAGMLNAWIGYDASGRLRVEPSQDDILDSDKPISWRFSMAEAHVLGISYDSKIADVVNDYIVLGMMASDYKQAGARAQNLDAKSDTNIRLIGRRTLRESKPEFATNTICRDYAEWMMKRQAVLHKAVSVEASQIFHLDENTLIEVVRTDRPGNPIERHLVTGFTRPLAGNRSMSITAVDVHDFPTATLSVNQ